MNTGGGIEILLVEVVDCRCLHLGAVTGRRFGKMPARQVDHGLVGVYADERPVGVIRPKAQNFLTAAGADHQDPDRTFGNELKKRFFDDGKDRPPARNELLS